MNIRQAKKLEKYILARQPDVKWWEVYRLETLREGKRALMRAWKRRRVITYEDGKRFRSTTPEWFMSNRIRSFIIRQPHVKADNRKRAEESAT